MINNTDYSVLYPDDLEGSVLPDGSFSDKRLGKPGVWIKEVLDDEKTVSKRPCPDHGRLGALLKVPEDITQSIRHMKLAASENPDDGPLRMSYPGFMAKSYYGGNVSKKFFDITDEGDENAED